MTIEDDIAFFERVPTLSSLGRPALRILSIGSESRQVQGGEVLFTAGDQADAGYVIQDGSFSLLPQQRVQGDDEQEIVAGRGALLGELAMITPTKWLATATALEPSTVIRISRGLFLKMLEGYPETALQLRDLFADRTDQWTHELKNARADFLPKAAK